MDWTALQEEQDIATSMVGRRPKRTARDEHMLMRCTVSTDCARQSSYYSKELGIGNRAS